MVNVFFYLKLKCQYKFMVKLHMENCGKVFKDLKLDGEVGGTRNKEDQFPFCHGCIPLRRGGSQGARDV